MDVLKITSAKCAKARLDLVPETKCTVGPHARKLKEQGVLFYARNTCATDFLKSICKLRTSINTVPVCLWYKPGVDVRSSSSAHTFPCESTYCIVTEIAQRVPSKNLRRKSGAFCRRGGLAFSVPSSRAFSSTQNTMHRMGDVVALSATSIFLCFPCESVNYSKSECLILLCTSPK